MTPSAPTRVACLTPPGQAALATLGVHGPRAWEAVRAVFRPRSGAAAGRAGRRPLLAGPPGGGGGRRGRRGRQAADASALGGGPLPRRPRGGALPPGLLAARDWSRCTWQDFLTGTAADPLAGLAAVALAEAPDGAHGRHPARSAGGSAGPGLRCHRCRAGQQGAGGRPGGGVDELARDAPLGRHLTRPWRVVVAGAPNVGKSSLVNALAGYQRSVVAPTPGTTRDVVTTRLALDGWPVELADTAGLRAGDSALEEEGIRRARATAAAADLCLWVLDAAADPVWPEGDGACGWWSTRWICRRRGTWRGAAEAVRVSALSGEGLGDLCAALAGWLVPEAPPPGAAVPFTEPLAAAVEEMQRLLAAGGAAETRQVLRGWQSS